VKGTINIDGGEMRVLIVIDFVIRRPDFMVLLVKVLHQIKYQSQAKD
jgi:hypothetical protein